MKVILPLYQCHKKVGAAIINAIKDTEAEGSKVLVLQAPDEAGEGYATVEVDAEWLTRNPHVDVGGYFVHYCENADDYTAYSPAGPFESGYTLFDESAPAPVLCSGPNCGKPGETAVQEEPKAKTYIAIAPGFVGGRLVEIGTVFSHEGLKGSWMEPHGWSEESAPAVPAAPALTDRKAIMAKLDAAGIAYFKGAPLEKLQSLLPKGE